MEAPPDRGAVRAEIEEHQAESLLGYLKAVFEIRDSMPFRGRKIPELWFRGADREHDPIPSLFRYEHADESDIRREFRRRGIQMVAERSRRMSGNGISSCATTTLRRGSWIGLTAR